MHLTHLVLVVQGEFKALVADVTHVLNHCIAVTHVRRSVHRQQGIQRVTAEVVDRAAQLAIPETEINTCIPLLVGFPLAVLVNLRQHRCAEHSCVLDVTQRITVEHLVARTHCCHKRVGVHAVVTYLTVTGTDLQVIQPLEFQVAHERLFAQSPSQCH